MASPITVGITATVAVPVNPCRANVRFQNTGVSILYLKKIPKCGVFTIPSINDYEVLLAPAALLTEAGEAFTTDSCSAFSVVSSIPCGILAIYETQKV